MTLKTVISKLAAGTLAACALTLGGCSQQGGIFSSGPLDLITGSDPATVAKCIGLGWDLGNQMDGHLFGVANETAWGNGACTQQTVNSVRKAGFTTIRIPVTWLGHIGPAPEYTIDSVWLNRVAEIVEYAEKAKMVAIINIHHDGAVTENWLSVKKAVDSDSANAVIKEQIAAMWTQIANKFRDKGNFLIFEAFNEIHDGSWGWGNNRHDGGKQYTVLNQWNQLFVNTVRATGGRNTDRFLSVPGYSTSPDLTVMHLSLPYDSTPNRLIVAAHCYDPFKYTLECSYDEWGHTAKVFADGNEDMLVATFARLKTRFIDHGIPVYMGEFGCSNRETDRQNDFKRYYVEYYCRACREHNIAPIFWDNGRVGFGRETSAVINHSTGEIINNSQEMIKAMVRGVFDTDPEYTLQSVYESAPKAE